MTVALSIPIRPSLVVNASSSTEAQAQGASVEHARAEMSARSVDLQLPLDQNGAPSVEGRKWSLAAHALVLELPILGLLVERRRREAHCCRVRSPGNSKK